MTGGQPLSVSAPDGTEVLNDRDAERMLADVPYVLYACRQAAKLFWSIVCKRYPELRGLR